MDFEHASQKCLRQAMDYRIRYHDFMFAHFGIIMCVQIKLNCAEKYMALLNLTKVTINKQFNMRVRTHSSVRANTPFTVTTGKR